MRQPSVLQLKRRARQRGIGLIDAVIAMAILSFGLLGMTRLQGRMVTASTDAQLRQTAMQMADELLSTALVDTANAACYTVPAAGACASEDAAAAAEDWDTRVGAALPGTVTRTVVLDGATGRMTVTIGWTGREDSEARQLQVVTDVRP
jgi:type IV pilus assembly protein PilV